LKVLGTQKRYVGLSGFDLEVAEHVGIDASEGVVSENNVNNLD
jgi:3,4-dihydroxy 2-butanone 4-phosphate synthase/GTP cyclohydrolase II